MRSRQSPNDALFIFQGRQKSFKRKDTKSNKEEKQDCFTDCREKGTNLILFSSPRKKATAQV